MNTHLARIAGCALSAALLMTSPAHAVEPPGAGSASTAVTPATLRAETTNFTMNPEAAAGPVAYGTPDSTWLTLGGGVAHDFDEAVDSTLRVTWSRFFTERVEFAVEGGVWYFAQTGDDALGLSASLLFRWHFVRAEDWTLFLDVGIGALVATDNVPATGTGFDFLPRAGFGMTHALDDAGTRLEVGLRWHHISNGHINGDNRNPGRDAPMVYLGLIVPL